jgi:23S rRNA (cytosine1962-C5)-methyltransferase
MTTSAQVYPKIILKKHREQRVQEGHPWVFSGAVSHVPKNIDPGSIVDVVTPDDEFVARGYFNPASRIPVRVLTRDHRQAINEDFFIDRITRAYVMRKTWIDEKLTNAYRIIHGESDFLPGLIVDLYADFAVMQCHTLGMDRLRDVLISALQQVIKPAGIYERSDVGTRKPDGLEDFPTGLRAGKEPPELVEILENGLIFCVDVREGQKTGFFLDQRENRRLVGQLAQGKTVLNCFGYSGGFSVYAAHGKADRVTTVDVSDKAIDLARCNMQRNGFDPDAHPCIEANVFDYLVQCRDDRQKFDVVIIDPPAFVKSQDALKNATRAYISLNRKAMDVLNPGGILVSASCSTQIDYESFCTILRHAATGAKRDLQIFNSHLQAIDHPFSTVFPEGRYLKCFFGVAH